jgi:hypothetical protein
VHGAEGPASPAGAQGSPGSPGERDPAARPGRRRENRLAPMTAGRLR